MEKISILLNKLKEFSEKLKEFSEKLKDFFLKNSRFRQLELVTVAEKRPKKAWVNTTGLSGPIVGLEKTMSLVEPKFSIKFIKGMHHLASSAGLHSPAAAAASATPAQQPVVQLPPPPRSTSTHQSASSASSNW